MPRRRAVLPLVIAAAAAGAIALPMAGLLAAPGDVLPDLRADAPDQPALSVYWDGRYLLRFYGYVTNVGAGPLDVSGNPNAGNMFQRVLNGGSLVDDHEVPVQYETADDHNHFHLKQIMRYSLRTAGGTEVAPGQKVGFCLVDSQRIAGGGPGSAVYTVGGNNFCGQGVPGLTSMTMGVSVGWRDIYHSGLAMQWVDVSDTTPGNYFLAAQTDPNNIIRELNESNPIAQSTSPVAVPGYVPRSIGPVSAAGSGQTTIPLQSDGFGSRNPVVYSIVSQPARGSVSVSGNSAVYTAAPGAPGTYSFVYSASQSGSAYPRTKRTATVTLSVGAPQAAVTISGAPASMIAGTSAQLSATVVNLSGGVAWSASGGTVTPAGLFVAPATPPPGGSVTVRATSAANPAISAQATIAIAAPPIPVPAPLPGGGGVAGGGAVGPTGKLTTPKLARNGRSIVVRTTPRVKGTLTITAIRAGKRLARCSLAAKPGKKVTCLLRVAPRFRLLPVRVAVGLKAADGTRVVAGAVARA